MELHLSGALAAQLRVELGWLFAAVTYSVHAALWGIGAWLLGRRSSLSWAVRHSAWKAAFLGPLATTSLALWAPQLDPHALGQLTHAGQGLVASASDVLATVVNVPATGLGLAAQSLARAQRVLEALEVVAGAVTLLGLLRLGVSAVALRRGLVGRKPVQDARLSARCEALRARLSLGPVTLSESAHVTSPLVLGTAEICLPTAIAAELGDAELDAVLAHELAHLERRDGLWFPLLGLVLAALWAHPLAHWVSRRVRQSAELACDERCVEMTGEPLALARALTLLAKNSLAGRHEFALATMTQPRSALVARVALLANAGRRPPAKSGSHGRTGLVMGLGLIALVSSLFRVKVAAALPPPVAQATQLAELNQQMNDLARREQLLLREVEQLASRSAEPSTAAPAAVRLLELEQELSHVRATQAWIEESLVDK